MAGAQVTIALSALEKQRLGYQAISLTEYDSDLEPEIAAGSKIEISGALFEFAAPESITGWAGIALSTDAWIKLVVTGATVAAEFTDVAPTWDTAKQGWYDGLDRYIGGLYKDGSGDYTLKYLYHFVGNSNLKIFGDGTIGIWDGLGFLAKKVVEIGDWDMDTNAAINVAHGLGDKWAKIRSIQVIIREDEDTTYLPLNSVNEGDDLNGGITGFNNVHINLRRIAEETFDNAYFNLTPFNRGWVTIEYEA